MDFALTDEQLQIRDAAQAFLADASDSAAVRRASASEAGYDAQVWSRLGQELGWCALAVPERYGGLGLGAVELALIQEQCGRHLLCSPFFSSVALATTVLLECAAEAVLEQYLPELAQGRLIAAVPLPAAAVDWIDPDNAPQATRHGEGWRLKSDALRVADGAHADLFLIFARIDENLTGLFAVPRETRGLTLTAQDSWDQTRRFSRLELRGAELAAARRIDDSRHGEGPRRSAALARLHIAAEQLGGAQALLDMTVAYTLGRKQFGRAIAGFQAVKHRCAEMMVRIEAARSAVYGAAALAAGSASSEALEMECAMARILASETYFLCAGEAIQLHGGVGFTWEYDPQLHFKRAQASSHWLGNAEALRVRLADLLMPEIASQNANRLAVKNV